MQRRHLPAVRPPLAALLLAVPLSAAHAEGLVARIEPGYALWRLDAQRIQSQAPLPEGEVQALLVGETQDAPALSLLLGYNVRDHVTVSAGLTATGWDLSSEGRGGAGLVAGEVAWHPVALLSPERLGAQRRWDAALFFGAGYGLLGERRALEGLHYQLGLRGEYFVLPWLSLGASVRYAPLRFNRYIIDWNGNVGLPLPRTSGGALVIPALTLSVHAPLGR